MESPKASLGLHPGWYELRPKPQTIPKTVHSLAIQRIWREALEQCRRDQEDIKRKEQWVNANAMERKLQREQYQQRITEEENQKNQEIEQERIKARELRILRSHYH